MGTRLPWLLMGWLGTGLLVYSRISQYVGTSESGWQVLVFNQLPPGILVLIEILALLS